MTGPNADALAWLERHDPEYDWRRSGGEDFVGAVVDNLRDYDRGLKFSDQRNGCRQGRRIVAEAGLLHLLPRRRWRRRVHLNA